MRAVRGLLISVRPRQWVKNLLVLVAPAAAGQITNGAVLGHTVTAFLAFTIGASALYLINDIVDAASDRLHPTKSRRPIAAGTVPPRLAGAVACLLLVASLWLASPWGNGNSALLVVLGIYLVVSLAYSAGIKKLPVIEFCVVASGFFLRALAGATASDLFVSNWFLTVTAFAALFIVVGKRAAEISELKSSAGAHRHVLNDYTPDFLRAALTLTATVVVTTYCLWAFDVSDTGLSSVHHLVVPIRLTVVPVVIAMLHILQRLERGDGGAPEDLVLTDRTLQILGVLWMILFVIGIHGS
jgi:decaprenyl-phosphate phosphoribosyltransferase